jgi:hypothetical protein
MDKPVSVSIRRPDARMPGERNTADADRAAPTTT